MDKNNQQNGTETKDYSHLPGPVQASIAARQAKAAERKELTPREQQLMWGREKLTEVKTAIRFGSRRTLLGFIENAREVTVDEKEALVASLEEDLTVLRNAIELLRRGNSDGATESSVPLPF